LANLAPLDVWVCRNSVTMPEHAAVISWHYRVSAITGTGPTDAEFAAAADAQFATAMKACINNNAYYQGTQVFRLAPFISRPTPQFSSVGAGSGISGTPAMARQTAGLIAIYGANVGRSQRGRKYIPYPSAISDQGDGTPTAAYQNLLITLRAAFTTFSVVNGLGGTATIFAGIYHRKLLSTTDVVLGIVRGQWATQRRRSFFGVPRRLKNP